jgi:hypothetical protein
VRGKKKKEKEAKSERLSFMSGEGRNLENCLKNEKG